MQKLFYTGHPLLDVGLATIVVFAEKDSIADLEESDLDKIANYMDDNYTVNPLRSFLTVVFPNSGYTQPAFFSQPEKQAVYKSKVLRGYRTNSPRTKENDAFMGLSVVDLPLDADVDGKLVPGRVYRQHIPLLTGEDVINFHAHGEAGLSISGEALLAFQALPLGSAKCEGRLLFIHSDNAEINQFFARKFLEGNRQAIQLAQQAGSSKIAEPDKKLKTFLFEVLLDALRKQFTFEQISRPFSITAYHMTNSGQSADLNIYHLPNQFILFIKDMLSAEYAPAWNKLVAKAWEIPKVKKGETKTAPSPRNYIYEDLFNVIESPYRYASRFIRTYFLREPLRYAKAGIDPRAAYSIQQEYEFVSWKLAEAFIRRFLNMQSERIEHIRTLADALASYIKQENDKSFFRAYYMETKYPRLRTLLIKANTRFVQQGNAPFLSFDGFIGIFEEAEEIVFKDWQLANDLILIRMVEKLYENGWLGKNKETLDEVNRPSVE
ncbi:MAG TPA: type I-B CRISPR-associated protein Cas8b1/Cst1 [Anaerolineales bacterium]|nr:type I-B CRISPR-associated protein Cas8b1/Cst1 [Anaerolineales bacterium]